jgi:CRP/FNR family transcriptional regulator
MLFSATINLVLRDRAMLLTNKEIPAFAVQNSPLAAYGEATLESLFDKQPVERFAAGTGIFFQGDPARHVFQITEGVARQFRILADGRRVITGFLFAGDIVGLSEGRRLLGGAESVTPVKLKRITRKTLEEAVVMSSVLQPQLLAKLCSDMAAAQSQMVLLSCKTAEERVATFLHLLFKRQAHPGYLPATIELPMTRLDIADYLGLTIETVSRNLTKLAAKGVISAVERFTLHVSKPRLLEEMAGMTDEEDDLLPVTAHRH